MSKKIKAMIAVMLAVVTALSFCACSQSSKGGQETSESSVGDSGDTVSSIGADTGNTLPDFDKSIGITEHHLMDTFGVSITATELTYTNSSVKLGLRFENTSDSNREVYSGTAGYCVNSVNGYMIHGAYMRCAVASGETAEDEISIPYNELYAQGISRIADIEVGFDIEDDDYHHEYTGPISVKTEAADNYDYSEDTYLKTIKGGSLKSAYGITIKSLSEEQLYSQNGITLLSQAVSADKDGKESLMLEFQSKADQGLYIKLSGLSINGVSVYTSTIASDYISPDKRGITYVGLSKYLEKNEELSNQTIRSVSFDIELTNEDYLSVTDKQQVSIDL